MKTYQVILKGFNGSTDETDHLVKWIKSNDKDRVIKKYPNHISIEEIFPNKTITFEDGLDEIIT